MSDWQDLIKEDATEWLLEPDNPSVRYFALRDLLEKPESHPEVVAAKEAIMTSPPVTTILDLQRPDGSWLEEEISYNPLYKSTVWQVIFLGELAADGRDERVRRGVERVFATMQAEDGSFPSQSRAYHGNLICCEGNTVRALWQLGYGHDPRTQKGTSALIRLIEKTGWVCRYNENQPCAWGVVKTLRAFAAVPPTDRTPAIQQAIQRGAEFLLSYDLAQANYPYKRAISKHWFKFSFPRGYNSDILEALVALAELGYIGDERLRPAIDYLLSKQGKDGRWKSAHVFTGRLLVDLDRRGGPSKWVTLNALRVLKRVHG